MSLERSFVLYPASLRAEANDCGGILLWKNGAELCWSHLLRETLGGKAQVGKSRKLPLDGSPSWAWIRLG